uniref:Uncharacterized protein LOC114342297 n=1 Tax=Diabrotica virgifera virgifera TaxID=50390 RepID=A0A6P7GGL1_DIAVI
MSFSRATRFVYKEPEIKVSPAEYNVPTSLGNIFTFRSKCQAILKYSEGSRLGGNRLGSTNVNNQQSEDSSSSSFKRSCGCKRIQPNSSTTGNGSSDNGRNIRRSLPVRSISNKQKINLTNSEQTPKRRSIFNRSDSTRNSFKEAVSSTTKIIYKNGKCECNCHGDRSRSSNVQFWINDEFIDDEDYYSHTSSQVDRWNMGNTHYHDYTNSNRRNFERDILHIVENMSRYVDNLNGSLNEFKQEMSKNSKRNNFEITIRHKFDFTGLDESQLSDKIQNVSCSTIDDFKRELLSSQNSVNRDAIFKTNNTADDICVDKEICSDQIEELPHIEASILDEEMLNLTDDEKILECDISIDSDRDLDEFHDIFTSDYETFDNEDIYNALSVQLKIHHKELADLEEDKTELMATSESTLKEAHGAVCF